MFIMQHIHITDNLFININFLSMTLFDSKDNRTVNDVVFTFCIRVTVWRDIKFFTCWSHDVQPGIFWFVLNWSVLCCGFLVGYFILATRISLDSNRNGNLREDRRIQRIRGVWKTRTANSE